MQGLVEGPSTVLYGRHLINIWGGRVGGKREKREWEGKERNIWGGKRVGEKREEKKFMAFYHLN